MLSRGFTKRCAVEYLETLAREKECGLFDPDYLEWAHANGFYAESACAYGLNEENLSSYLSDYDYCRLWPLNGWQRIWINDKLTLYALLEGGPLEAYLPEYYYYSDPRGILLPLKGSGYARGFDGFLATLRSKGEFACKPCNGTEASGFHRLSYSLGTYYVDSVPSSPAILEEFVRNNSNYVFTEFICPSPQMAAFSPLIHTIRVLVINPSGTSPEPIAAYLRFSLEADSRSPAPNYAPPINADICSYDACIDPSTGVFGNGVLAYANRIIPSLKHPASGITVEGTVDCWPEVLEMLQKISLKVGACEYLGFDVGITDKGPKIMEINSHSGIKYLQLFTPLLENKMAASYYHSKLEALNALSKEERLYRNDIVR